MDHIPLARTVRAPATRFTGDVWLTPGKGADPAVGLVTATVRFTPGARTNWHSHAHGQALLITEGEALVVNRNGQVVRARQGDTIWTPPGEQHWHGATTDTLMVHVAALIDPAGDGTTWLEPVDDATYRAAHD